MNKKTKVHPASRTAAEIFEGSRRSYGKRRLSSSLKDRGYNLGVAATRTLMKQLDLVVKPKKKFVVTTQSNPNKPVFRDLVQRNFAPNRSQKTSVWFADITYISTKQGWLYLYALMDRDSRKVLAHKYSHHLGAETAIDCIKDALIGFDTGQTIIHHSDRGCQYTSEAFVKTAQDNNIQLSMSRKGNCWDNAAMESFFATLKREWVSKKPKYTSRKEAIKDINLFIYQYYNSNRKHSSLGYKTPNQIFYHSPLILFQNT